MEILHPLNWIKLDRRSKANPIHPIQSDFSSQKRYTGFKPFQWRVLGDTVPRFFEPSRLAMLSRNSLSNSVGFCPIQRRGCLRWNLGLPIVAIVGVFQRLVQRCWVKLDRFPKV